MPTFGRRKEPELVQVVLDDGTVERLRRAAVRQGLEVEELIVDVLYRASLGLDDLLPR